MKFFTDHTVKHNYLLMQIKKYRKKREKDPSFFDKYDEVLVDPGVYQLKKSEKYDWEDEVDVEKFLDSLPENHYFAFDYPCDMNPDHTQLFLNKSWDNAVKYCHHPQYIVSVQSGFKDFVSFVYWFDKYNNLPIKSNFIALGNLCRIQCVAREDKRIVEKIIYHTFKHSCCNRIHIYGLTLRMFEFVLYQVEMFNVDVSIDSTNWTYAVNKKCRDAVNGEEDNGGLYSCSSDTRQLFFDEYLKEIRRKESLARKQTQLLEY